jgi:hypothetical protein
MLGSAAKPSSVHQRTYAVVLLCCLQATTPRMQLQCSLPWWLVLHPSSRSRAAQQQQQAAREERQAAWQQVGRSHLSCKILAFIDHGIGMVDLYL